ncbi:histone-like nucleoid-structuring protein Lsr2 [Rhodococcus tukisamuensis]|uniref:histone-like nucleoid-structuring protein Lsr2 n=1 Tax=Rhodococcus tukisamuensis TaxID=168276 RepID=UPI000934FC8C|nr:Lsr2 family protein [Rhodococcus tukisamuensis]
MTEDPAARKTIVQLIDDIDETPIDSGGESITFSVNGVSYAIDLNTKNATEFHRKLDYYIAHATKVSGAKNQRKATAGSAASREQMKAIRQWAAANGLKVSARGRISAEIQEAFAAAH